jgi:hypothetical protein
MTQRRAFLGQLGLAAAVLAGAGASSPLDAEELRAGGGLPAADWDMSWLDLLAHAKYRATFNVAELADFAAASHARRFMDQFHEVEGTSDADTRAVFVFRHQGTPIGFNDVLWDKYAIGEARKIDDPDTHAPARRNINWKAAASGSADDRAESLEALHARGAIMLVCNIAAKGWAETTAKKTNASADDVYADMKANLLPGAILAPSGIFALIRAQNAGCAYMPGS